MMKQIQSRRAGLLVCLAQWPSQMQIKSLSTINMSVEDNELLHKVATAAAVVTSSTALSCNCRQKSKWLMMW